MNVLPKRRERGPGYPEAWILLHNKGAIRIELMSWATGKVHPCVCTSVKSRQRGRMGVFLVSRKGGAQYVWEHVRMTQLGLVNMAPEIAVRGLATAGGKDTAKQSRPTGLGHFLLAKGGERGVHMHAHARGCAHVRPADLAHVHDKAAPLQPGLSCPAGVLVLQLGSCLCHLGCLSSHEHNSLATVRRRIKA